MSTEKFDDPVPSAQAEAVEIVQSHEPADTMTLNERFASLEISNQRLASDVRALTATLQVVNELQIEQKAQARRQAELDSQMALTKQETATRLARNRRAVTLATAATAIGLPLVSLIVYSVLIAHVDDLLERNTTDRIAACKQRNEGTMATVRRERLLASISKDERERRIHADSADEIEGTLINCDTLYQNR